MFRARSLRARLTATYAVALVAGLVLFAAISYELIDRSLVNSLDARLRTAALALASGAAPEESGANLEVPPRGRIGKILGKHLDGAMISLSGTVVADSGAPVPAQVKALARQPVSELTLSSVTIGNQDIRVAIEPVRSGGRQIASAVVWQATDPIEEFERTALTIFAIAIPIIVTLGVIAASIVTERGLKPLADITALAEDIEGHDLSARLNLPGDDELGRFGTTFDRMLDRLQAAFARQRRFTADASHELRAPLSVIRAEADLALRQERSAGEYGRALSAILSEADRLEALIGGLLSVARAESTGAHVDQVVDFAAIVEDVVGRIVAVADAKHIQIERSIAGPAWVRGNESALASVPMALLHNALDYARSRCEILVASSDGYIQLTITDDGPGFTDQALAHATERFWRHDRSQDRGGSGLGLAIVRAIVEAHGGTMTLSNGAGGGAQLVVRLPSAQDKSADIV